MITENREAMYDALAKDLRRNQVDADLMDVEFNVKEVDHALKHLHEWMEPEHPHTPLLFEPGHLQVRHDPLGVTLIIGAWNEPFMLTIGPLVPAIAAGNTAVIKPSEISVASSELLGAAGAQVPRSKGVRRGRGFRSRNDGAARAALGLHLLHR